MDAVKAIRMNAVNVTKIVVDRDHPVFDR